MSFLDLYSGDQQAALKPRPEERPDLPATFADTFKANWDEARLFSQSVAHGTARTEALQEYLDDLQKKTGADLWKKDLSAHLGNPVPFVNGEVAKLKTAQPDLDVQPLTDDGLERSAIARSHGARKAHEAMAGRERTWGGTFGALAGSGAGVAMDPINIVTAPVAPAEGLGVLATALRWGVIGAAQNAAIEAVGAPYRETVKPGYLASGEPLANIVEGGAGAAILGGGAKALGNLWSRVKTGSWPTTVRDAGNVLESEANIATTSVLPGVEGEVAHRAALGKTIDDVMAGRPVDVSKQISQGLEADLDRRMSVITDEREKAIFAQEAAKAGGQTGELPFEATAAEAKAEMHVGTLAEGVTGIAKMTGYDMPKEEATAIAQRVVAAKTDDEARGILAQVADRPHTLAGTLPSVADVAKQAREDAKVAPLPPTQTPNEMQKTLAAPDHEAAVRSDIDRARMNGDVQIPVGRDENGEPIMGSLDGKIASEVDAYKEIADHIQACAAPQPEPAEAARDG